MGKKGSKAPVTWDEESKQAFEDLKKTLLGALELQVVNTDVPSSSELTHLGAPSVLPWSNSPRTLGDPPLKA